MYKGRMISLKKYKFIIVGSGYRSLLYVNLAKACPQKFELCAMLCRTKEKADKMAAENDIYTTTSIEECKNMDVDFVVVAVNKTSIAKVSIEWMDYGFTVLCETPVGLDRESLMQIWQKHLHGGKIMVAEQYMYYPSYQSVINAVNEGLIGAVDCANVSLAHEYHGASLIREFLGVDIDMPFTVRAKTYEFSTVETFTRYEHYKDGRQAMKKRTVATLEFDNGKVAFYDFDSEQYRSPIRINSLKIQGTKGMIKDDTAYYLDENYDAVSKKLYENKEKYDGLSKDQISVAKLMEMAAEYNKKDGETNLKNAIWDAYVAIVMKEAGENGGTVRSECDIWKK